MTESQTKLSTLRIPSPQVVASNINILFPYMQIVRNRDNDTCDSLRPLTPLDRIELRLFRLFFFDVLEGLPHFRKGYDFNKLRKKASYVVHSLLHLSQREDRSGAPQAKKFELSTTTQQPDHVGDDNNCLDELTNLAPTDEQKQLIVSRKPDSIIPRHSQKHLCDTVPPTLPHELLACILQHLDTSRASTYEGSEVFHQRRFASLARCALVNRTWYRVTLSLIWKNVRLYSAFSGFAFLRGLLSMSIWGPTASQLDKDWPGTYVVRIKLFCKDRQSMSIWRTLAQSLSLFPKLRRLTLAGLPSTEEISVLFEQDLPSLRRLSLHKFNRVGGHYSRRTGLWDYGPSIDREGVRAFFSRLTSVKWKQMDDEDIDYPALLDTAHENLRQISFPDQMPDLIARRFFDRCPNFNTLSVVQFFESPLSRQMFEVLATKCSSLRALSIRHKEDMDPDGFEYLMELRGPQLVALELVVYSDYRSTNLNIDMNPQLMRSITKHCRSLEYLNMDMTVACETIASFEAEILSLFRKRGQMLRYLYLGIYDHPDMDLDSNIAGEVLIPAIADSCPNLRGLEWDSDLTTNVPEDLLKRLFEKCRYLQILGLHSNVNLFEISDPHLKAKLRSLQGRIGKKGYYRWESYCSQTLHSSSSEAPVVIPLAVETTAVE